MPLAMDGMGADMQSAWPELQKPFSMTAGRTMIFFPIKKKAGR
jgi:hypothetical protein